MEQNPSKTPDPDILLDRMRENAILIYGPRKAGTTLLQRLIDGGSLYVYPTELKVKQLSMASWSNRTEFLEEFRRRDRLLREEVDGFDRANFERKTSQDAQHVRCFRDAILVAIDAAIESSPPGDWSGWAAKEVGGDFHVILNDWKKMFPDSKVVVILRNPFFVSRSVFRKRDRQGKNLRLREVVKEIVHPWQIFDALAAHIDRRDLHLLYYEDLVTDTEAEMRSVARFLGIEFSPQLTHPTMFGRPAVVSTSTKETTSVFRERKPYWSALRAREAALLGLIGGAICLKNLALGRITFRNGAVRLAKPRNQALPIPSSTGAPMRNRGDHDAELAGP